MPEGDRRAGWEGCNIIMRNIPSTAKIPIIRDGEVLPIKTVVREYNRVYNLQTSSLEGRGWLIDTLKIVERLGQSFSLNDVYAFANEVQLKHPSNHHVYDKLRQQLQLLRDKGIIEFTSRGKYKRL